MTSTMIIKVCLISNGKSENKILKLDKDYTSVFNTIKSTFNISGQDEQHLSITYKDSENDRIDINKQEDWNSAIEYMTEQKEHNKNFIFRLLVTISENQSYSVFDLQSESDIISNYSAIQSNNKAQVNNEFQAASNPKPQEAQNPDLKLELPNEQIEKVSEPNKQENLQEENKNSSSIYNVCDRDIVKSVHSERSRDGNEKSSSSQRDQQNPQIVEDSQDNNPNCEREENNLNGIDEIGRSKAESIINELNRLKELEKLENEKRRRNIVDRIKMNINNQIDANGTNSESNFVSNHSFSLYASKEAINFQLIQEKVVNSLEVHINECIKRIKATLVEDVLASFRQDLSSIIKNEAEKGRNFEGNFNQPAPLFQYQQQPIIINSGFLQPQGNSQVSMIPKIAALESNQIVYLPKKISVNSIKFFVTIKSNFQIDFTQHEIIPTSIKTRIQNSSALAVIVLPPSSTIMAGVPSKIEVVINQGDSKCLEYLSKNFECDFKVVLTLALLNKKTNNIICNIQPSDLEVKYSFSKQLYDELIVKDIRLKSNLNEKDFPDNKILEAFLNANENKEHAISILNS